MQINTEGGYCYLKEKEPEGECGLTVTRGLGHSAKNERLKDLLFRRHLNPEKDAAPSGDST